jgi:acyl-CoA reductase-like NAD-dependent aldehyde dehydrogenase
MKLCGDTPKWLSAEYGLRKALFTEDINSAMHYINEVETGIIHINEVVKHNYRSAAPKPRQLVIEKCPMKD